MTNADPAFKIPNPSSDWSKKVTLGIKPKIKKHLLLAY